MRSEDSVFGAFHRQQRSAGDEMREVTGIVANGDVSPLLTKFGHLGRLAGHHPGACTVSAQDLALLTLAGVVGIPPREQRRQPIQRRRIGTRHPEHPHRHDRAVLVQLELFDELRQRGGRRVTCRQRQHLELRLRVPGTLLVQPGREQIPLPAGEDADANTKVSSVVVNAPVSAGWVSSRSPFRPRRARWALAALFAGSSWAGRFSPFSSRWPSADRSSPPSAPPPFAAPASFRGDTGGRGGRRAASRPRCRDRVAHLGDAIRAASQRSSR